MATDDIQRLVAGQANAPTHFKIPGNGQIRPKAIYAAYDGSGAAGAFKPALKITSDAGELVGIYDTDDEVAAGASANVSWFPGGGLGGGGTAPDTGVQYFFGSRVTTQAIAAGDFKRIGWTHHVTSDSSVFSVTTSATAADTVHGLKAGVYIAMADLNWASPQTYQHYCQIVSDFFNISAGATSPVSDSNTDTTDAGNQRHIHDSAILLTQAVPGEISLFAGNADAVSHNVTFALYAIAYLPNSTLVT